MLFADEVVDTSDLEVPSAEKTKPSERELNMAKQLVESLSAPLDPSKYHDDYRDRVMELIEMKAAGQEIAVPAESAPAATVVDLMAALEASLAAARAARSDGDAKADGKGEDARHRASA
jgi:DNA end-binding protein Ku